MAVRGVLDAVRPDPARVDGTVHDERHLEPAQVDVVGLPLLHGEVGTRDDDLLDRAPVGVVAAGGDLRPPVLVLAVDALATGWSTPLESARATSL